MQFPPPLHFSAMRNTPKPGEKLKATARKQMPPMPEIMLPRQSHPLLLRQFERAAQKLKPQVPWLLLSPHHPELSRQKRKLPPRQKLLLQGCNQLSWKYFPLPGFAWNLLNIKPLRIPALGAGGVPRKYLLASPRKFWDKPTESIQKYSLSHTP